jgi:serine/threonine protein kinase
LKIADFGVERYLRFEIPSTEIPGPKIYETPELKLGIPHFLSRAYDIWSLGCVFQDSVSWLLMSAEEIHHEVFWVASATLLPWIVCWMTWKMFLDSFMRYKLCVSWLSFHDQ